MLCFDGSGRQITVEEQRSQIQESIVGSRERMRNSPLPKMGPATDDLPNLDGSRRRVRVIRNAGLGEVLLTTPLIRRLNEIGLTVDVVTNRHYVPLFWHNPHVTDPSAIDDWDGAEGIVGATVPPGSQPVDSVIDLRNYSEHPKDDRHRATAYLRMAGLDAQTESDLRLDLVLTAEDRKAAEPFLYGILDRHDIVGYVWRSTAGNRNWSERRNLENIRALADRGLAVVVLDGERQPVEGSERVYNLTGLIYDLRMLAATISHCSVVVTPDTGVFHIAQALAVPTVAYFGAFPLAERATYSPGIVPLPVAQDVCPVYPCRGYSCGWLNDDGESPCITRGVTPQTIADAVASAIAR